MDIGHKETSGRLDNWQSGKSLSECNLHMMTSEDSYDVTFRVGKNEKIVRAHRYVLISRSSVFHAMLCGPLSEKGEITVPDVDEEVFAEMLKYLYTNTCILTSDNVTGLLYLSKKYAVGNLERQCLVFLGRSLSPENACTILEQAHGFDEKELYQNALKFILQNGGSILKPGFNDLCHECLDKVVRSEYLVAGAGVIFEGVLDWARSECHRQGIDPTPANQRRVLGKTVFHIPFAEMTPEDFAEFVVPTRLLSSRECTKLFCFFSLPYTDASPFRIRTKPDLLSENQAGKYYQPPMYVNKVSSFLTTKLNTCFILKPSRCVYLVGFITHGSSTSFDYMYRVQIECDSTGRFEVHNKFANILGKRVVNNPDEVELLLPEPCLLRANTRYRILILTMAGLSRHYGVILNSKLRFGNSEIDVKLSALDMDINKGLISRLILKEY